MKDVKKNEARFTIKFNPINPRHREAMRILNDAGRGKAALIADALCMYVRYGCEMGADSLMVSVRGVAPDTQNPKVCIGSEADKVDDTLLNTLVDAADLFFN